MNLRRNTKSRGTKIVHSRMTAKATPAPKKKDNAARGSRRWVFVVALVAFVCGTAYILLCTAMVDVTDVHIVHATRVDAAALEARIAATLEGVVAGCITRRNFFFVRSQAIADVVREDPRVRGVRVTKVFPHRIVVDIEEYTIFPVWCVRDGAECHVMDGGCIGRQIDPSSETVQNNPFIIINDVGHDTVAEGTCPVTPEDIERVAYLGRELVYAMDTRVVQPYTIDFRGGREVTYTTNEGWTIVTDLSRDADMTLTTAKLFMTTVMQERNRSDLVYVDVRFPEKIFYKMKDMPAQQTETVVSPDSAAPLPTEPPADQKKP